MTTLQKLPLEEMTSFARTMTRLQSVQALQIIASFLCVDPQRHWLDNELYYRDITYLMGLSLRAKARHCLPGVIDISIDTSVCPPVENPCLEDRTLFAKPLQVKNDIPFPRFLLDNPSCFEGHRLTCIFLVWFNTLSRLNPVITGGELERSVPEATCSW